MGTKSGSGIDLPVVTVDNTGDGAALNIFGVAGRYDFRTGTFSSPAWDSIRGALGGGTGVPPQTYPPDTQPPAPKPDYNRVGPPAPQDQSGDAGGTGGSNAANSTVAASGFYPDHALGQVAADVIDDDAHLPQAALAYTVRDVSNDNSVPDPTLLTQASNDLGWSNDVA